MTINVDIVLASILLVVGFIALWGLLLSASVLHDAMKFHKEQDGQAQANKRKEIEP